MDRPLLVTGASGYVAGHVVTALREHGVRPIAGTALGPALDVPFDEWSDADLTDRTAVRELIERLRPLAVVHLAARRDGDLATLLDANARATDDLLATLRDVVGTDARVVVVGSAAEIGACEPDEMPLAEDAACRPIDPYGVSKLAQAGVAHAAFYRHGQDVVRVRLFNLIGPHLPATLLPGRCATLLRDAVAAGSSGPLEFRDLGTERDYIDIRDAARAIVLALTHGTAGTLFHAGSGAATSGRRVVESLIEAAGGGIRYVESVPSPRTVAIQVADPRRAERALGWSRVHAFDDSISDLWRSVAGASVVRP